MKTATANKIEAWDKEYVWHPFTQMKEWRKGPVTVIEKGEGNSLIDTRGKRYLDGVSSLWCNVHGHRVRSIDAAVKRQLGRIAHSTFLGLANVPAVELARRLVRIAPRGLEADHDLAQVERAALRVAFAHGEREHVRGASLPHVS